MGESRGRGWGWDKKQRKITNLLKANFKTIERI